jgi:methionine--tRNA ligase beta chain
MKDIINFKDFSKLDVRVGKVVEASVPEWSEKLIKLKVDLGEEIGEKTIMAGIKSWYKPEDLEGNKYLFLANLEEKKMGEGVSQGMMLAIDLDDRCKLIPVDQDLPVGAKVS